MTLVMGKIKDSKVMALDLQVYDNLLDKDPDRSYSKVQQIQQSNHLKW